MQVARLILPLLVVACASTGGSTATARPALPAGSGSPAAATAAPRPTRGGANLIDAGELATLAGRAQSALEVIQTLRPAMLRARATSGQQGSGRGMSVTPHVFLDASPFGDLSSLRTIGFEQIREIRFLSAADATTLWGTGYPSGVIQIVTKK